MDRLTANSTVPLRKTKSVDEVLITGSHQTADTEFELNHYIQGDRTVGLSANTEFDLNRSIHGHSTTVDLSANTEFGLNHSIHGHSRTVDLSANTEFGLNRSIHGHSTTVDLSANTEFGLNRSIHGHSTTVDLSANTEFGLNHSIHRHSTTVDLSANTEFGLNHSIHGHSTDEFPFSPSSAHYRTMFENQQNYKVPLSQSNLHHLTNPYLKDFPGPNDPGLKTWLQWSPSSVGYTNVEVDSDSDSPNISKIEPTNFEAEALGLSLQKIKNDELEQIRELGSGTYGVVYHGKWKGSDVVIKRIKLSLFAESPSKREHLIADFLKEPSILASLSHPNVIAFYGIVHDGPDGSLATVTEFMVNGSLKQVLKKKDRTINLHKKLIIAMDAAFGMEYLHWKNIVHFDLKCENLLVNMGDPHRPVCKIGGVGLSRMKRKTLVSGDVRGSLPWMVAPELLNPNSQMVTERIDVYSFGIVMWEMLTGEEPYANMHFTSIIGDIVKNSLRPQVPSWCDPEWKSLMENCWASDPSERPSFSEISQKLRKMYAAIKLK